MELVVIPFRSCQFELHRLLRPGIKGVHKKNAVASIGHKYERNKTISIF